MINFLVLGGGGFIGKNLIPSLASFGNVKILDKNIPQEFLNNKSYVCKTGDYTNMTCFDELLDNVDIVFHLISTTLPSEGTKNTPLEISSNVLPTVNLLESMRRCNVKKIIFASSGGTVYGDTNGNYNNVNDPLSPICSYGLQKQLIENCLMFYNRLGIINCKIARITNPYGIGQQIDKPQGIIPILIYRLRKDIPITVLGDGSIYRDFIYMDDLINLLLLLCKYNGDVSIFNVGFGKSYSIIDLIRIIEEKAFKKFKEIMYQPSRDFDIPVVNINIEKTISELAWEPKISLENGIELILNKIDI